MTPQEQFIMERRYLKSVTPATVVWYEQAFRRFAGALDSRATAIERIGVLKERGLSVVSINCHLRVCNAFWKWKGQDIRIPKLKEEQKILATLSPEAIKNILNARPAKTNVRRAHLAALTILDCGLRASELLGLTGEHVDFDNLVIRIVNGKGGKHRLVPFSPELRKHLFRSTCRNGTGKGIYVFGTKNNTKVTVRNLERDFQALGKKLAITGVRFSPHTLRHSFACEYLKRGGNLEFLRRILGHTSLVTTQKYLRSLGVDDLCAVHQGFSPLSARR